MLSEHFSNVVATDISEQQLSKAEKKNNITYSISDSTHVELESGTADLVTVAQAVHWFNFENFYHEVRRVLKPNGILALIGYGVMRSDAATDKIIQEFYHTTMGPYWDKERKLIDEAYVNIPFPLHEVHLKNYSMKYTWTIDQLIGYFSTWSALQHYRKQTGEDPLPKLREEFILTGHSSFIVDFPLFFRIGKQE